jgi:hypothetical protein
MSCARCGAEARHVAHPLRLVFCEPCMSLWLREPSCSFEAVCAAAGLSPEYRSEPNRFARFDAELLKRTRAWIAESTKEAA